MDQTLGKPGSYLAGIDRAGNIKPMTIGARLYRVEQQVRDSWVYHDFFYFIALHLTPLRTTCLPAKGHQLYTFLHLSIGACLFSSITSSPIQFFLHSIFHLFLLKSHLISSLTFSISNGKRRMSLEVAKETTSKKSLKIMKAFV